MNLIWLFFWAFFTCLTAQSIDYPDNINTNQRYVQSGFNNQNQRTYSANQNNQNQNSNSFQNNFLNSNNYVSATQNPTASANNNTLQSTGVNNLLNNTGPGPQEYRTYAKVQLRSYTDSGFRLSSTTICQCPSGVAGDNCTHSSPYRKGYSCYFSFMIILASSDPEVKFNATPFVLVDTSNGGINPSDASDFQQTFVFRTFYEVTGFSILVSHSGAVIDATTGAVLQPDGIVNVDRFAIDFSNLTQYNQAVTVNPTGSLLGTSLQLSYTMGCLSKYYGPDCNLQCNTSTINNQIAVCQSVDTGYYSICKWQNGNSYIQSCQNCPWGIRDNSYCVDANGNMMESHEAGVVSSDYKTATIILAIVAGILFLLLAAAVIISICLKRRSVAAGNVNRPNPGYNNRRTEVRGGHLGNAETTPLNSSNNSRPVPSPRNGPVYTQKPTKSTLRPYQYPPAAHLGGDTLNETLNSSFATNQSPLNVSRSADV